MPASFVQEKSARCWLQPSMDRRNRVVEFTRPSRRCRDGWLAGDDPEKDIHHVNQDPDVGMKCTVIRGLRPSHAPTAGCLWLA